MSKSLALTTTPSAPKIQRSRTGCKACRRRGKRCDETRPICQACQRLSLGCCYGVDFSFRNVSSREFQQMTTTTSCSQRKSNTAAKYEASGAAHASSLSKSHNKLPSNSKLPLALDLGAFPEAIYLRHFDTHVRHLLPTAFQSLAGSALSSPCLRNGVLCLAASNLSMLDTHVQRRDRPTDVRRSVSSPIPNRLHHNHARQYHDLALFHYGSAQKDDTRGDKAELLAAKVLLAYYHHASTDHVRFRLAVWDTVRFVLLYQTDLMHSPSGEAALQLWHRLCTSHRPSKPPALLLEGEGPSAFGPNLTLPDARDHLYLTCVLGMNADDLIYDITIRTVEIRTRMVVFRCTAAIYDISEQSKDLGSLAHALQNKLLGRLDTLEEYAEAEAAFVQGSHLLGLLEIQRARLLVWQSRLGPDQLHLGDQAKHTRRHVAEVNQPAFPTDRPRTHRDAMNALYYHLCNLIFGEAVDLHLRSHSESPDSTDQGKATPTCTIAHNMLCRIDKLDFAQSSTLDVYNLSLAEVLLQLVLTWQSTLVFDHILDVIWPRVEGGMRGYEHSHYPTHMVKRVIALSAEEWHRGRGIMLAMPAVSEQSSKATLLDLDNPVDLVIYGRSRCGAFFVEKKPLP